MKTMSFHHGAKAYIDEANKIVTVKGTCRSTKKSYQYTIPMDQWIKWLSGYESMTVSMPKVHKLIKVLMASGMLPRNEDEYNELLQVPSMVVNNK